MCGLRSPFPYFVAYVFQNSFFTTNGTKSSQNGSLKTAQNHKSLLKTHPQSAPIVRTCKKTPSGRGQTSKIDDSYTLSAVFSEAQGHQQGAKMGAKMEPRGTQNHKNPEKRALKKTSKTQHCNKLVTGYISESQSDYFFVSEVPPKSQQSKHTLLGEI